MALFDADRISRSSHRQSSGLHNRRTGRVALVRLYEREDPGSVSVSRAHQVAAFTRIFRSILSFFVLTEQTMQFGSFFGGQAVFPPAFVQAIPFDPVADGLCRGLELLGLELFGQCFGTVGPERTRSTICWRNAAG